MKLFLIACAAAAALGLASYNAITPARVGTLGLRMEYRDGGAIAVVAAKGPAARAGIRTGDTVAFARAPLATRAAATQLVSTVLPRPGETYEVPVVRSGTMRVFEVAARPTWNLAGGARYVDFGLALLYLIFAGIILVKASRSALSELLVVLMVMFALINALADYQVTAPNTMLAFTVGSLTQYAGNVTTAALVFAAVATLPGGLARTRRWIRLCAIPLSFLIFGGPEWSGVFAAFWITLLAPAVVAAGAVVAGLVGVFGAVATIALVHNTPHEDRVRSRWFASTLIVCWFLGFGLYAINAAFVRSPWLNAVLYYAISFSMVGPVYATLRHRLVDIDVVLSRSAIFASVSLLLVMAFVAAEWLAGKVADALVGGGHWRGVAAEALSFAAAIAIGLSARSTHVQVERRVNALVFRDRARRLKLLEAFAREADIIDSREILLKLAYESLLESLDTDEIALYVADGDGFACVRTSSDSAPERLDKSDRLVLRLLYRPEPFVSESATFHAWLIVPLMVRANVTGFLACGVKRDRTVYLGDELRVLETLSHHVATSYALLQGTGLRGSSV